MMGKPGPRFFCWFTIAGAQGHPGTAVGAWAPVWANAASLLTASLPALCSPCTSLLPPPLGTTVLVLLSRGKLDG